MFLRTISEDSAQRKEADAETIQFQGDLWKNFTDASGVTSTQQAFMMERLAPRREAMELTDAGGRRATSTGVVAQRIEKWDAIRTAREFYQNPWEAEQDACVKQSDDERETGARTDAQLEQEDLQNLALTKTSATSFAKAAAPAVTSPLNLGSAFGVQARGPRTMAGGMVSGQRRPASNHSFAMN